MDKQQLLIQLTTIVETELKTATEASKASAAGATHEENRAEGNKDMRSTEASYLARGQAMRVEELMETLQRLRFFELKNFGVDDPIGASALVCLAYEDESQRWYWIIPNCGGYALVSDDIRITSITPQSPLGRELVGKTTDDDFDFSAGGKIQAVEIIHVS